MKRLLLPLCCLAFFLAPCKAFTATEAPGARLIVDQYLGQAKSLLDSGKAEEAWEMLRNLVR